MAFDAPRKTLDEIRREIEAEFGEIPAAHTFSDGGRENPHPPLVADADADVSSARRRPANAAVSRRPNAWRRSDVDEDEVDIVRRAQVGMQARRRGGYIAAGVIGCLIGQLILVGFMVVRQRVTAPPVEVPMERVTGTPPALAPGARA